MIYKYFDIGVDKHPELWYTKGMIRNSTTKGNEMELDRSSNEYKKIVKHLMAKGYSKLEAKRLAQQASTQLAMSRMAMMKAIIPDNRG